jgi:membrane-associated phospholipid phosphatase
MADRASSNTPAPAIGDQARYGLHFLSRHGWRMALWFVALLLPVWGFASLIGEVHQHKVFAFDDTVLDWLHSFETPALDRFFVLVSKIGFLWGTIPIDAIALLWLTWHRRYRDGLFFGLAVIGSALLNVVGKNYFQRTRPDLWLSIAPENTYSFPSGHAMGSATLGMAMILLTWRTRWRWPMFVVALVFVLLIGLSRLYLGVHYPSDILGGWMTGIAWVCGMFVLVDRKAATPPPAAAKHEDVVGNPA